jgi:hypothetical protein
MVDLVQHPVKHIIQFYHRCTNMSYDENFGKAMNFVTPKVNMWLKDLFGGVEQLSLPRPQKELVQALTVETLLYNSMMSNEEIIAILSDIIRNIATGHAYNKLLDWQKRAKIFKTSSKNE